MKKTMLFSGVLMFMVLFLLSNPSQGTSLTPQVKQNTIQADLQELLKDLDAEEIIKIDVISRHYHEQRVVLQDKLREVQEEFNKQLHLSAKEPSIRLAFVPVARAMEDLVVNDVLMMSEINRVLAEHIENASSQQSSLVNNGM